MVKDTAKNMVRAIVPLPARKRLSIWVSRLKWVDTDRRNWWAVELIRDFFEKDVNEYHKFLWANHLSYALTYEASSRFGKENMKQSRRSFFSDAAAVLRGLGVNPATQVKSVLEVGCSLGYQLRYMETDLFPSAQRLDGIDIDGYAIESGESYLRGTDSKVRLTRADMESFEAATGSMYDVIVCTGVLMYLDQASAARLVERLLRHTGKLLAFSGLAHPDTDNSYLENSVTRASDGTFIHNIDSMIENAGGKILARRWEGARLVDGHTIYFVFASPA